MIRGAGGNRLGRIALVLIIKQEHIMQQVATLASLDRLTTIEIGDTKILLVQDGGTVHAFAAKCPHAGAPLAQGAVCDGRLICPWHKAEFRLHDGALLQPPALEPLTRYPVRIEGDAVLVSPEPMPPAAEAAPPADAHTMLIVGAGAAGTAAACALREFGFSGRIVIVGSEPGDPYDRTALSKFVLQGAMPPDKAPALRPLGFYETHRIERVHGEAAALDPASRTLRLADGGSIAYDRILIATGGVPRRPDIAGADLPHVHTLRSREDATAILAGLTDKPPVVIVGGSFIGLEAASALRAQDVPVSVVSPQQIPFKAQFGEALGSSFRRLHESQGVQWHGGRSVARIEQSGVVLDDARSVPAGLVLLGLGIAPATGFASGLERTEDGGIVVDAAMRAAEGVFAAGDCARFPLGAEPRQRVEHWRVAQQHARIAAAGMLDQKAPALPAPFFWTYHYGKRYEVLGHPREFDQVQIDGDFGEGDFLARLTQRGDLVGIVACGREEQTASMIASRPFSPG